MNTIDQVKNILTSPKNEWEIIETEQTASGNLLMSYLLLLALIPAVASFIGYGIIGHNILGVHIGSVSWGIRQAITSFVAIVGGAYLTAFIVNALAEKFESTKDFNKAFQLVVYSYTPMCIAGILYILPALAPLAAIAGLYGLYILYLGIKPMMKTPDVKVTSYFVVSLVCVVVVSIAISAVLGAILLTGAGTSLRF